MCFSIEVSEKACSGDAKKDEANKTNKSYTINKVGSSDHIDLDQISSELNNMFCLLCI